MRKRHAESPKRDLVHGRVVDVVRAVQADDGAESGPGTEGAAGEWSDRRRCAVVDALCEAEGAVCLDAVTDGYYGSLRYC